MDVSHIIQKDKEIHLKIFVRSKIALVQSAEWFQDTNTGVLIKEKFRIFLILGKTTYLLVNAHEYQCENPSCAITTFAENVNGFFKAV